MKITLGISGASGAVLAKTAIDYLSLTHELFVVASDCGALTFEYECGVRLYDYLRRKPNVSRFDNDNLFAPISSGTNTADCMIILPCSASTVGRLATGSGDTLLTRAADVMLKERRRLVIGLRESPLSAITLKNLETLSLCGAIISPLVPPFYKLPQTNEELCRLTLGRFLLTAGIENDLISRWGGKKEK